MYDIMSLFISLLISLLVAGAIWLLKTQIGVSNMQKITQEIINNKALALMAVRYAQQCFTNNKSYTRYAKAADWLATEFNKRGIRIDGDQIKILIESALRELKDEFGEEWGKAIEAKPEITS